MKNSATVAMVAAGNGTVATQTNGNGGNGSNVSPAILFRQAAEHPVVESEDTGQSPEALAMGIIRPKNTGARKDRVPVTKWFNPHRRR